MYCVAHVFVLALDHTLSLVLALACGFGLGLVPDLELDLAAELKIILRPARKRGLKSHLKSYELFFYIEFNKEQVFSYTGC